MVEAAILYQLTRYVEWTKGKESDLLLCVLDNADLKQSLQQLLGKKINGRRLNIADPSDRHAACDLLYLPEKDLKDYSAMIAPFKDRQVLFVSDAATFIDMGGMIGLVEREGRISIELNMQALQASHFTVNPSLIDIATRVIK